MIDKRLIDKLGEAKVFIGLTVLLNTVSLIANVVSVFTVARLLENVYHGTHSTEMIIRAALTVVTVIAVRAVTNTLSARTSYLSAANVKKVLREDLYKKLLRLGISYNEKVATSEVVQLAVEGIEQLEIYFGAYLPQLFYSLLAPLLLFAILSFVNLRSAVVLLVCVPLIPISIVAVQRIAKRLLSKYWDTYTSMGDSFLENIQGLTTLKIYRADGEKSAAMDVEAEKFRKITMRVLTMQLNSITIMDLIAYGGAAVGVIISINEFLRGNIGFAATFAIIMLSAEFFIPLRLLGSFFHIAMNGMAASDKYFNVLDLQEPVPGTERAAAQGIVFEGVNFAYEADRQILNDVNVEIPPNRLVAFVGESGSGKSTIAALIMGINKNYQGSIRLGDKELAQIAEAEIMRQITLVNHNSYIFKGTVRDNLLMGNEQATEEEMKEALRKVNLLDFVSAEKGLDTEILERGANLSGGQRQRLALARAILHDTPMYIFDEVTSNIDAESEALIMEIIQKLAETKTIVVISHRMANVVNADRIYVLAGGRVVESGRHRELVAQDGVYTRIYSQQKILEGFAQNREVLSYA
jgi:ABC-type transport system involved in cytochrome bd biosynthesis fused ATPase/permease subunit|nr:ABC transporter ATP-binding protein/permease [Bacillota bacterium]